MGGPILAIDLGRFNSVPRWYDPEGRAPASAAPAERTAPPAGPSGR